MEFSAIENSVDGVSVPPQWGGDNRPRPAADALRRGRAILRMSRMKNIAVLVFLVVLLGMVPPVGAVPEGGTTPPEAPIKVTIAVSPSTIGAGSDTSVTVKLDPKPGIKMNKYPKIKLLVPAVPGLVDAAEQTLGNPAPPPADQMETNYFHGGVDPLTMTLHLDGHAAKGPHEIKAKLSYYYCVAASGFCAPAKAELTIPVTVR